MRVKRKKFQKRYAKFIQVALKFMPPFKILIDTNLLHTASTISNINIQECLRNLLDQQKIKIFVTRCGIAELRQLLNYNKFQSSQQQIQSTVQIKNINLTIKQALNYKKLPCDHGEQTKNISPDQCILSFLQNRNQEKFWVATEDEELRKKIRKLGCVPILYLKNNILSLEKPSRQLFDRVRNKQFLKTRPQLSEYKYKASWKNQLNQLKVMQRKNQKKRNQMGRRQITPVRKLKRKAKAPNPMSMLSKKDRKVDVVGTGELDNAMSDDDEVNTGNETKPLKRMRKKRHKSSKRSKKIEIASSKLQAI